MLKILIIVNTPKEIHTGIDYQEKYKQLNDAEIKEILRLRKAYQPEAANAAIQEAIERGIIHSEQDLFAPEFNQVKDKSFSIFPQINKPDQKEKIISSIQRIFYITGIIPLLYGGLKIHHKELIAGLVFVIAGIVWIVFNTGLKKINKKIMFLPMFSILFAAFVYSVYSVYQMKTATIMDFSVVVLTFLISVYCLFFARSVSKR